MQSGIRSYCGTQILDSDIALLYTHINPNLHARMYTPKGGLNRDGKFVYDDVCSVSDPPTFSQSI